VTSEWIRNAEGMNLTPELTPPVPVVVPLELEFEFEVELDEFVVVAAAEVCELVFNEVLVALVEEVTARVVVEPACVLPSVLLSVVVDANVVAEVDCVDDDDEDNDEDDEEEEELLTTEVPPLVVAVAVVVAVADDAVVLVPVVEEGGLVVAARVVADVDVDVVVVAVVAAED